MTDPQEDEAVLAANAGFYRAFESLDAARMEAVWAKEGRVSVVHPGWPLITGRDVVLESWSRIFDNTAMMQFTITGTEVNVDGDLAWVVCTENLTSVVDGQVMEGKVQATNIYARRDGSWRIVHHHGGPAG